MHVFQFAIAMLVGLFGLRQGPSALLERYRRRARMRSVQGVFIGDADGGAGPGVRARSGVFRYTTEDGYTLKGVSSWYDPFGRKPGRIVTIVYDPQNPPKTAEVNWVNHLQTWFIAPLITLIGLVGAGGALVLLLTGQVYL